MKFQQYIDSIGAAKLARMLNCSEANVYKWRNGTGVPSPDLAYIITKISLDAITFEDIFVPHLNKKWQGKSFIVRDPNDAKKTLFKFDF